MIFRQARVNDIKAIQVIRNSVKENTLSDPALVTDEDCRDFITRRGRGWVCEIDSRIVGFAVVDLEQHNVWALFVDPEFEGMGIGKKLQYDMLEWYFSQTTDSIWLGTAPRTRAEQFYRRTGWKEVGINGPKELKFEMSYDNWKQPNGTREPQRREDLRRH